MGRSGIHFTRERFGSEKALRSSCLRVTWQMQGAAWPFCQKAGGPFRNDDHRHLPRENGQRSGDGERGERLGGARQLVRNHEPVLALPQDPWPGRRRRNSFRFFPAGRFARSNGTNGTEKRTVLGELHRGLSYLMTGKGAWVAGAERREAPGAKLEHLGRRLRLRHQPPRSWQLLNGGDQRGVAKNGMNSVLPRSNLAGARQLVRNHEQTGVVEPSENGRLPPVLAHQLARAQKSLICPKRSPGSVTY